MTARLLIDQCVSRRMAAAIFAPIADVAYVADLAEGAPDTDVLALAAREQRILVTEDFDFGRLIFKDGAGPPPGLIHLTLAGMTKAERYGKLAAEAEALIAAAPGRFVVFSKAAMRARLLPKGAYVGGAPTLGPTIVLQKALQSAGWTPDRNDPEMAARLKQHGVPTSHPVFRALTEFGALALGDVRQGEQCSTSNVFFDLIMDDDPNAEAWGKLLGTRLVGFAWTDNSHGQLYMSEDGRVFGNSLVHDAFCFLGVNLPEALMRLLSGRRAQPMLRPDQTKITLYGDTIGVGDPALYAWER